MLAILGMSGYTSASEMSEREEKIKKEIKTDEYGNVKKEEVRREVDTKSEAERDLEDTGDKIKAGARAMGAKREGAPFDCGFSAFAGQQCALVASPLHGVHCGGVVGAGND
jgi:hypothetical protein